MVTEDVRSEINVPVLAVEFKTFVSDSFMSDVDVKTFVIEELMLFKFGVIFEFHFVVFCSANFTNSSVSFDTLKCACWKVCVVCTVRESNRFGLWSICFESWLPLDFEEQFLKTCQNRL